MAGPTHFSTDRFALQLGLFYAAYFFFGGVQLPFFPLWLEARGLDARTIGLVIAVGLGKLVSGLLYRVSPFDPAVLTIAAVVLSATAMLACYLPARRATRIVPLEALRSE